MNKKNLKTSMFIGLPTAALLIVVALSLAINLLSHRKDFLNLVTNRARAFFDIIQTHRLWNARHGGVYVPVTDKTRPNPYLDDPLRDLETTQNIKLTMINPAYMTRQVAEIAMEQGGVVYHITSLRLLRPENRADPWEAGALREFEEGVKEKIDLHQTDDGPFFRYMAPLFVKKPCLKCHAKQGYKVGDVRGGISVSFPADTFLDIEKTQTRNMVLLHILIFLTGAASLGAYQYRKFRSDEALKASEEQFRGMFQSHSAVMLIVNPDDGRIIDANKAAEAYYGYPDGTLTGMEISEINALGAEEIRDNMSPALHNRRNYFILKHRLKGGELRDVEVYSSPVKVKDSAVLFNIIHDITDRKSLEQQLVHSQKMESLGHLAGGVAHDFNNLLTAIMGYASVLEAKLPKGSPLMGYAGQIQASSKRASELTRGLLSFSRKQSITLKTVNINDVAQNVNRLLARLIGEDIELRVTTTAEPIYAMADRGQLEQVLINLATNSMDAMPEGGLLTITTEAVSFDETEHAAGVETGPGKFALISVSDTGHGIEEETMQKIFEPFFTTKDVGKGTGLGLSIAYGIIEQHGGRIAAQSEPGEGTTFRIYLPAVSGQKAAEIIGKDVPPRGGTETVLLADDSHEVRQLMAEVLMDAGYRLIKAVDGEEAVENFKANRDDIDLVILDVAMPRMDGRKAAREIKVLKPDMKILFMSGHTFDIISKKGILKAEIDFISKPVMPDELLAKVREVLDK